MVPSHIFQTVKRNVNLHQWHSKTLIAAVSGGSDSMALCYILQDLGIDFVIAHCNFQLRGNESMDDEAFVSAWAKDHNVPCYIKRFDTRNILADEGGNLQDTCRNLRYNWFEQLRASINADLIATAHHQDDVVETLLMNLMKGTGIAGLHGILPQQGKLVRPLLPLTKKDLLMVLEANGASWREDSSNKKDDYLRNKIRHTLLPQMNEIVQNATENIYHTSLRMQDVEALTKVQIQKLKAKVMEQRGADIYMSIGLLKKMPATATLLFEILKPFGFQSRQVADVLLLLDGMTGKYLMSDSHRVIKHRDFLVLTPIASVESEHILIERSEDYQDIVFQNGIFKIQNLNALPHEGVTSLGNHEILIDAQKLQWPLLLRPYKTGDYFYPLGMQMKKKKISKLLKDMKYALHEKEQVWVLESQQKIVWVLGIRQDERFKVQTTSKQLLKFTCINTKTQP